MILRLLALQALLAAPGEIRTFDDWTVGCDNGGACQAVALGARGGEGSLAMSLRREASPDAEALAVIDGEEGRGGRLVADGRTIDARLIPIDGNVIVHPTDSGTLIAAMRTARSLELRDSAGETLGRSSLAGLPAALSYMDERQGRLGSVTALARPGARPAAELPSPPPLPEIRLVGPPEDVPAALDVDRIDALRREVGCAIEEVGGPDDYQTVQIETGRTLILLACGTGAYNLTSIALVAEQDGEGIAFRRAAFDAVSDKPDSALVNVAWDSRRRLLREFPHGRGLGDCGTRSDYGWDGERFRLVHRETMQPCRGARTFVTVWRARIVRR